MSQVHPRARTTPRTRIEINASPASVTALAERGLSFVPVAVLSAIIVPELMIKDGEFRMPWFMLVDGELQFVLGNVRFAAGVVAIIVAWRTRNTILTIAAGMLTLWVLQWLVG